jgi:hypothetical protein
MMAGANVFILFDTSNYMYRGFVFAQDAIAEFVRSLDGPDRVAFYSYSRDLSRGAHSDRRPLAGAAWSAHYGGRRRCRSVQRAADDGEGRGPEHGPESQSWCFPTGRTTPAWCRREDVAELAQSKGIPIYMISTREAKLEPVSSTVFKRMSAATGGEAYFAKTWKTTAEGIRLHPQ